VCQTDTREVASFEELLRQNAMAQIFSATEIEGRTGPVRRRHARGIAPTEPVGAKSLDRTQHVDALWAALLGRCSYFLRTSFMPQHMSFAGAPPSQPTPAISM
jgi:hypothetical protein